MQATACVPFPVSLKIENRKLKMIDFSYYNPFSPWQQEENPVFPVFSIFQAVSTKIQLFNCKSRRK
jgi:hypothetical protein